MAQQEKCKSCGHKQHPDGGHCYMFRLMPTESCAQHAEPTERIYAMRMQYTKKVAERMGVK